MTTTPEPEDPRADPGYRPAPGLSMSDAFYRAIGDYCHAENAKAEAGLGDQPVPYTLTAEAEAVLDGPEPGAEP
jgi:hypothetical protein